MKLNCKTHKTIEFEGYRYNVLCIEQNGTFDYYLQKVGYGDLMHICGLEKILLYQIISSESILI